MLDEALHATDVQLIYGGSEIFKYMDTMATNFSNTSSHMIMDITYYIYNFSTDLYNSGDDQNSHRLKDHDQNEHKSTKMATRHDQNGHTKSKMATGKEKAKDQNGQT